MQTSLSQLQLNNITNNKDTLKTHQIIEDLLTVQTLEGVGIHMRSDYSFHLYDPQQMSWLPQTLKLDPCKLQRSR